MTWNNHHFICSWFCGLVGNQLGGSSAVSLEAIHVVAVKWWMELSHSRRVRSHVWKLEEDSWKAGSSLAVSLSPRVAFSVWPAWASLHVGEDSCSSAYQFSACIMLATPSLDKANVGRACTRVWMWEAWILGGHQSKSLPRWLSTHPSVALLNCVIANLLSDWSA